MDQTRSLLRIGLILQWSFATLAIIQSPPLMIKQPPADELLFQVKQRQDENDKPFIIECEANGEPAPMYKWTKNGKPYEWQVYDDRISQQPGRGTLVITSPREEDIGQYQCFATNEWGTATSNSVFVRKSELNNFKDGPSLTISAEEGNPFSLTCEPPDGWPKPSVYWMIQYTNGALKSINSSRMTVDPEGTLWFSNVTRIDASDDYLYACSATSFFRNEYKLGNKVFLNVIQTGSSAKQNKHEPVKQYVSKRNMIGYRGKKMKLWCIYGGTPLPEIRWKKKGGVLPREKYTYDNYGKTLVIKLVDFDDEGSYECEASNGVGNAKSYSINLKVHAVPYFTKEPEVINAAEGENVTFECEAEGFPSPDIKWIHNGKLLDTAEPNPRRKQTPNSVTIINLKKEDTGNYGCNATNDDGYVYKDVYVNVLALAPEITEPPKDIAAVDGVLLTLICRVFGAPKPQVKWIRGGQELTGGRYATLENGDLVIKDVLFSDSGNYTCYARNKFGSAEATGHLVVKEHTRIVDGPEDYEVEAGSSATFRCNAVSDSELDLVISWLKDGEEIDFEAEPRFVQSSDQSLTISKTTELDTGEYTCVARTELDSAEDEATLTVQDVPNPPKLENVVCGNRDAEVHWKPMGDNRAPILSYTIQYNTSFTPDSWENAFDFVPATETSFKVSMSPWANYTFRVIARNKVGPSTPSGHSEVCLTPSDVPARNPDNVEGKGSAPDNLVIYWTPMPQIEHNAPKFKYHIYWKRDIPGRAWNIEYVTDWRQSQLLIPNQLTFKKYRIKVVAHNEKGESNVAAKEVIGYSGEDVPTEAPANFTVVDVIDAKSALLSWNAVSLDSIRGHFKGYKIQTWTADQGEDKSREIVVSADATNALVNKFKPHDTNFVRVLVFNGAYNGPPSETLSFRTPEGTPGPVDSFEALPIGSSALYLMWKKPESPNGILTGYRIFYQKVESTKVGPIVEREPRITDPRASRAKLAGLKPATKYRITIKATTAAGSGIGYYIEQSTRPVGDLKPDIPSFRWEHMPSDNGMAAVKVIWMPNINGRPGSHFFVQYKKKARTDYQNTKPETVEDFTYVRGLEPGQVYEFRVVSVDGEEFTASYPEEIETHGGSGTYYVQSSHPVATAGWFIGMMLAVAILLLILILVCIVKRNRGGKYAVHEREAAAGRGDYPEEGGFPEYSQPLDNRSHSRGSMSSDVKVPPESDTDSMAEYGEGETASGMGEDGSFIGQYGRQKKAPETETSSAFATLV